MNELFLTVHIRPTSIRYRIAVFLVRISVALANFAVRLIGDSAEVSG